MKDTLGIWSPPRFMQEAQYNLSVNSGWIPAAEDEVDHWRDTFAKFHFDLEPVEPWETLSYELRLLNLESESKVSTATKSHAELSRELRKTADKLYKILLELSAFNALGPVSAAALETRLTVAGSTGAILEEIHTLRNVADYLAKHPQAPRWRDNSMRRARSILAVKAKPLFERFFGLEARPDGGSHFREIEECNMWTRFFQAVAFAFYDEQVTPDRQRVLWDAFGHRGSVVSYSGQQRRKNI